MAFRKGLQTLRWAEGRNVRIDIRWTPTSDVPAMQRFAKELVALQPDRILSHNTPTTATLLQHTRKWLELLKEAAPHITRVAFLFNPTTAPYAEYYLGPFRAAAASVALEAIATPVRDISELETAIAGQARTPNAGLVVMTDSFLVTHRAKITALAARYRVPAVYPFRDFIDAGGLLFYGNDLLAAKALGLTIPPSLLLRADQVIE